LGAYAFDEAVLSIRGLTLAYENGDGGLSEVVREVDLTVKRGEILGLVGESGCGKSTLALAGIGYRTPGIRVLRGEARLGGRDDLLDLKPAALRRIWGSKVAFVSQQANLALNPSLRVGVQLADPLRRHLGLRGAALRQRQIELLAMVDIPDPPAALERYPFQFSGGQQQRIAIAIALSCRPEVLVLDEPTTGLDAATQVLLSDLLKGLVHRIGIGVIYVSHDLLLLHALANRIAVMYAGQIVELGTAAEVVSAARHPYTRALMLAAPSVEHPGMMVGIPGRPPTSTVRNACAYAPRCDFALPACRATDIELLDHAGHPVRCLRADELPAMPRSLQPLPSKVEGEIILTVRGLRCTHPMATASTIHNLDLELRRGETVGIIGESGSGKSTLLRAIAGLLAPDAGEIAFQGQTLAPTVSARPRATRGALQLIFQNPDLSLNPRQSIRQILSRPIRLFRAPMSQGDENEEIARLLESVRLSRTVGDRFPSELSGGQKQRIAIARAFAARPAVLLCDEITSALDVSVQASVLQLLNQLAAESGAATIFVSHDLAVIRTLADHTAVMRNGLVVEAGPTGALFAAPTDPYTRTLLAAVHDLPR
jgi:peptide/nickel transport system ATP-binding protein